MIRIVLIDNQEMDRIYIQTLLSTQKDFEVAGVGKDGYDAIKLVAAEKPDIAILNIRLPLIDGMDVTDMLRRRSPATAFIILFNTDDDSYINQAVQKHVSGLLIKAGELDKLIEAVRLVHTEGIYLSPKITAKVFRLFSQMSQGTPIAQGYYPVPTGTAAMPLKFSRMEFSIMTALAQGLTNREIAAKLRISPGTVRNNISMIIQKTDLEDRTQVALYAYKHHIKEG
jgi:DNA-binding NarL/FixJ family response regulator